jgi:pimeloyl-ACP methyl ester carboxylesterase
MNSRGLLLLHGALGSRAQLEGLQQRIGRVAIDMAGHGELEIPTDGITFDHFLEDIDRAFQQNGWSQADLFGYSMGGYAALLYAAEHADRIRSVVTVGTKYIWTPEGLQKELRMLDPDKMLEKVPAFAKRLADVHGAHKWRQLVAAVAKSMSDLAAAPLLTDAVKSKIQCPVLLCVGDGDTTAVPDDTRAFSRGIENAEVIVLPNTKHPFESVDLDVLVPRLERFWAAT